jgi:hypothetical protein
MQRFFNLAGALGFLMSGTMLVGTAVVYSRIPSITKHYMEKLQGELTEMITDMVPTQIGDAMPELPTTTGPVVELPKSPF